jgi:hypothetical protein
VVVFSYSTTATAPTLPASWTSISSNATLPALRIQYRQYDGVWTMPTFTGAGATHAATIRPAAGATLGLGTAPAPGNATAIQIVWPAMTLAVTTGTSQVLRGGVHNRNDVVMTVPTGHTLSPTSTGIGPGFITCRVNTTTSAASATTGGSTRSDANSFGQVEIRDVAAATITPRRRIGRRTY